MGMTADHLPVAPLTEAMERQHLSILNAAGGHNSPWYRLYAASRRRGYCTAYAADVLAIRMLGLHPAEVWDKAWYECAA